MVAAQPVVSESDRPVVNAACGPGRLAEGRSPQRLRPRAARPWLGRFRSLHRQQRPPHRHLAQRRQPATSSERRLRHRLHSVRPPPPAAVRAAERRVVFLYRPAGDRVLIATVQLRWDCLFFTPFWHKLNSSIAHPTMYNRVESDSAHSHQLSEKSG